MAPATITTSRARQSFFACADGFVYLYMTSRAHWPGVKALMGHPEWLDAFDDDWLEFSVTAEKVACVSAGIRGVGPGLTQRDCGRASTAAGRAAGPGQWRRRSAPFTAVSPSRLLPGRYITRSGRQAAYPTVPYALSASPARNHHCRTHSRPAHRGGRGASSTSARHDRRSSRHNSSRPGIRAVDRWKAYASSSSPRCGPVRTPAKLLALLGAEVIKIETAASPEEMRAYGGTDINHAPVLSEHQSRDPQRGPRYQVDQTVWRGCAS